MVEVICPTPGMRDDGDIGSKSYTYQIPLSKTAKGNLMEDVPRAGRRGRYSRKPTPEKRGKCDKHVDRRRKVD